jgi:C4-dicarboxylate-binding protein DctP
MMRTFRWLLAGLLLVALGGAAQADEPILIRFSHVVAEDTPKGIGAELFKQKAEARLPGRVHVEVYPRARRFDDETVLMALLFGDVEMAAPSFVQFRSFSPAMQVFELPFLFPDVPAVDRFEHGPAGRALMDSMLSRGIRGLGWWHNGMRAISAERPLRVPSDAEGLTVRIEPSAVFQAQYQRVGAVGIQMPFSRVTDAIREGLVDGQENTWSNIASRNIQNLHKHYLELDHSFLGYMVVTSTAFWNKLPSDVRTVLEQVLAETTAEVNRRAAELAVRDRATVERTPGVEIVRPSADDLEAWRRAFVPVWQQFEPQIGSDLIAAARNG